MAFKLRIKARQPPNSVMLRAPARAPGSQINPLTRRPSASSTVPTQSGAGTAATKRPKPSPYSLGVAEPRLRRAAASSSELSAARSAERSGQTITVEELPEGNSATGGSVYRGSVLPTMYKKLIENSLDILYDKLQESRDKQLVVGVSSYLMLAVYKMFRLLYEASPKNVSGMFRVGSARWDRSADAAMSMAEGDLAAALTGEDGTRDSLEPATLALSTDQLARDYPRHATSLFNLVKNAEEAMRGLKKAE